MKSNRQDTPEAKSRPRVDAPTTRMVEIPDSLHSLFSGTVEERDGAYVIAVPSEEIAHETLVCGEPYRVGVFAQVDSPSETDTDTSSTGANGRSTTDRSRTDRSERHPPVDEGEVRDVTVESLGDQGDGIAKVERGYVVIVPDARPGDEVTVEIEETRENVAFATVVQDDPGPV